MRRRLDLAASIVTRPPVLFLDAEPTTGLSDPTSRQRVWQIIRPELVASGVTVLLTTQYLEEADQLARTIIVVDHGHGHCRRHSRRAEAGSRAGARLEVDAVRPHRRGGRRPGRVTWRGPRRSATTAGGSTAAVRSQSGPGHAPCRPPLDAAGHHQADDVKRRQPSP